MSHTASHVFDKTLHKSNLWLADMMEELRTDDPETALHALRAGLHALRDRLTIEEAADLAAQMPMLVRGLFFEGWRPAGKPERVRSAEEFLLGLKLHLAPRETDPWLVLDAVVRVLHRHVSGGELVQVRHVLPRAIQELWPELSRDEPAHH